MIKISLLMPSTLNTEILIRSITIQTTKTAAALIKTSKGIFQATEVAIQANFPSINLFQIIRCRCKTYTPKAAGEKIAVNVNSFFVSVAVEKNATRLMATITIDGLI